MIIAIWTKSIMRHVNLKFCHDNDHIAKHIYYKLGCVIEHKIVYFIARHLPLYIMK